MRVFQETIVNGKKIAILLDDENKKAYEAVWEDEKWETDFSYEYIGVDAFDVAGSLDFEEVRRMGYTFV